MIYDKEHYNQVLAVAKSYRNDVERLEKQLAITENALELAIEIIFEEFGCSKFDDKTCNKGDNGKVCYQCIKEEYLIRAKEMLENE